MHHFTVSLHSKLHREGACVFSYLHLWEDVQDILRATAVTRGEGGGGGYRKLSRHSCGDSNLGQFDHESDALTTGLSPLRCHLLNELDVTAFRCFTDLERAKVTL